MRLKQYRTEASYRLEQADRLQKHFGGNYSAIVEYAYKLLIQNHAHDSICGCSTDAVHFENYSRYEKILQIANTIIEELKLNNNEAFELVKKSGYEFKSTEKLEGFNIIRQEGGFEDRILYDTQKIPVTEDYTQIYTLQKRQTPQNEVQMEIREKELKINNIGIQFVRYQDNGDTYNYGPGAADMGEFATILEVIRYDETDSFLIRTDFFNVFLTRTENLINFRFEWNNQIKDCIWQVKFDLPNPVCKTFSEDMNMIIERDFDPNYNMRQHLPKERGIEAKTNFAPMQRYIGAQGFGIVTKGLTEYEVFKNSISITLLRSTGVISNPKNSARSTPAGPPLEVPGAQQLGFNRTELSIGFFEPEDYLKYVHEVYPQIV